MPKELSFLPRGGCLFVRATRISWDGQRWGTSFSVGQKGRGRIFWQLKLLNCILTTTLYPLKKFRCPPPTFEPGPPPAINNDRSLTAMHHMQLQQCWMPDLEHTVNGKIVVSNSVHWSRIWTLGRLFLSSVWLLWFPSIWENLNVSKLGPNSFSGEMLSWKWQGKSR